MKFLKYMLTYYFRNKRGFCFIFLTVMIAVFLFCILESISSAFEFSVDDSRIIVANDISFHWGLPLRYKEEIARIEGVEQITYFHIALGSKDPNQPPIVIASIEPDHFFPIMSELVLEPGPLEQFKKERNACLIGHVLAERHGWKVGDAISLKLLNSDQRFDFVIRGIYKSAKIRESELIYCHYEYHSKLIAGIDGKVINYIVKVKDVGALGETAQAIDRYFENSSPTTRSQPEKVFAANMQATEGNFALIFRAVGAAVLFATILVIANTFIMSTRQQIPALSTLRVLGYSKASLRFLVMSESLFVCFLSGLAVCGIVYLLASSNIKFMAQAMCVSLSIGVVTGLIPMIMAGRSKLGTSIRKIV